MHVFQILPLLPIGLLVSPLPASTPSIDVGAVAIKIMKAWQPALGLDQRNSFAVNGIAPDPVLDGTDVRIYQYYQGVPVFGGQAILHLKGAHVRSLTDGLLRKFELDPKPSLTPGEALALATRDLAPKGPFALPPTTELVVARLRTGSRLAPGQDALVYHIHLELENGVKETVHADYLIDAHSGAIAKRWDSLTSAGVGHSQYSGTVAISTTATSSGFELRDRARGDSGNTVVDLAHGTGDSFANIVTSAGDEWGDGQNYDGGPTTSTNGQTAAVDAAYGSQWTWDYYKNIHGRNGIDGNGTATSMRVHYDTAYDNAFWSDSCFCMTFGDGSKFKSLEAIDVMGHEMSHGVCAATAGLQYYGESGGLNEANSDIHGTMVEFYSRGGSGAVIGEKGGNWTMGEQLETAQFPTPLRYMYKPSKDGVSPDAWSSGIESLNVHNSSGPMNRCFYFLSQGASADPRSDSATQYLPLGMPGIGNDKAARIWYRAMVSYLTSGSGYAEARTACISAAKDLHGAGGAEEQAVWNAFHGINVGDPWPTPPVPANTVTASILAPAGDVTVAGGTPVAFRGSATDSNAGATLAYAWSFGDGATAKGASASHAFANPGSAARTFTVTLKATDDTGVSGSASRAVTVNPVPPAPPAPAGELLLNGGFEAGAAHWEGNTEKIGAWSAEPPHSGTQAAWLLGSAKAAREALYQFVVWPTGVKAATLGFSLHVDSPNPAAKAVDTLAVEYVQVNGTRTLGSYSNLDAAAGYSRKTLALPAAQDEVGILLFRATGTGAPGTSFVLDDVSLLPD